MIFSNAYPYKPVGQSMETLGLISGSRIIFTCVYTHVKFMYTHVKFIRLNKLETRFERGLVFTFTRDLPHITSL